MRNLGTGLAHLGLGLGLLEVETRPHDRAALTALRGAAMVVLEDAAEPLSALNGSIRSRLVPN